jgi:hypothetical protein
MWRGTGPEACFKDIEAVSLDDVGTVAGLARDAEQLTAQFRAVHRQFAEFIRCHCQYADLFSARAGDTVKRVDTRPAASVATAGSRVERKTMSSLKIFLCHSSGDKAQVRGLFNSLCEDGYSPWLDEECLIAGQDWDVEIRKAVKDSHVVIVCLSTASTTKAGYVQKEIRLALDVADEQPEGAIFVIPLRLEECVVPDRLARWHWVDIYAPNGYKKLVRALGARSAMLQLHSLQESAR